MRRSDETRRGIAVFEIFPGGGGVVGLAPVPAGPVARPHRKGSGMTNASDGNARDGIAKTPPAPVKPKPKQHPGGPATKAQRAALMRADKMVIKRMRKK